MGREEPAHLVVGFIQKPHGVKGEVFIGPLTDHPEGVFAPGVMLFPGDGSSPAPDPDRPPLRLTGVRPFRNGVLATVGGVEDRNQADQLRGTYLFLPRESLAPLQEGEVFYHHLLGMSVETVDGRTVGTVQEVFDLEPADLLEVRTPGGTLLVPFRKEVVVEVSVEERRLVIDPPPGLLELDRA